MSTSKELTPIKFYEDTIFYVEKDDQPFTPVKPIVENLGLAWQPQHRKLTDAKRWGIYRMVMPSPGGPQEMLCLPLRKLPSWLLSISPRKVKPEIRPKLELYQEECDQVLWDYWTKGHACKPGVSVPAADDRYVGLLEKYVVLLEEKLGPPKKTRKAARPLTNEELARIYALEAEGLSMAEIGRRLSRSSSVVSFVLKFRPRSIQAQKEAGHV